VRTLHVDLGPTWRGGQNQVWLLLRGLRARGVEAELLGREDAPLVHRAGDDSFVVHPIGTSGARWRAAWRLRKLLRRENFEIVHAHDAHGLTAAWLAGAHRRARLVATRRVVYPLGGGLGRARYRSAQRLVAVSHAVAAGLRASSVPAERITVVHSGVELPPLPTEEARQHARERFGLSGSGAVVGSVGMFHPDKGQESLLRALVLLRRDFPDCRLLLAGDGPERARLEMVAHELGIAPAVHFTGFVKEVEQVYAALDIFLFPAVDEGLGTALLAAMAHALPVVALARGGCAEAIEHGRSGLLAADREPGTLAGAVRSLLAPPPAGLADTAEARRLGEAARARIAERFSAEQMVEGNLRVYEELVFAEKSR